MSKSLGEPSPSPSKNIPSSLTPRASQATSPSPQSHSRAASIARLASSPGDLVENSRHHASPYLGSGGQTPLAGADGPSLSSIPGSSALAAALKGGDTPIRYGTPPRRESSSVWAKPPALDNVSFQRSLPQSRYGSFDTRSITEDSNPVRPSSIADPEVIKKHLARPSTLRTSEHKTGRGHSQGRKDGLPNIAHSTDKEEDILASSLQLQGGDTTRDIVRWQENAEAEARSTRRRRRSTSFVSAIRQDDDEGPNYKSIIEPGGFRRDHLRRQLNDSLHSPRPPLSRRHTTLSAMGTNVKQTLMEFLTIYTIYDQDFEDQEVVDEENAAYGASEDGDGGIDEHTALLSASTHSLRQKSSSWSAALKLLKSFVGTGVLFLPRAFLNGGMLFSVLVLVAVAIYCFWCFVTLVAVGSVVTGEYGDIGRKVMGRGMYSVIQVSLILSQVGFVAAYLVFTSSNLHAFILAISDNYDFPVKYLILVQTVLLLPVSLYRKLDHLKLLIVVADVFIFAGLFYVASLDISALSRNHGVADIILYNPKGWTLFIGTAIFTFEGIGLILPIRQDMRNQEKFPVVLGSVMVFITILFVGMGALSYAAFGSATETVILLNLPQDDKMVNGVQFIYSLAILFSIPLQLIVAVDVIEKLLFRRSGKTDQRVKWGKNIVRFFMVIFSALIAWAGARDLDKFVALIGSFACIPLVSIYPVGFGSASFAISY